MKDRCTERNPSICRRESRGILTSVLETTTKKMLQVVSMRNRIMAERGPEWVDVHGTSDLRALSVQGVVTIVLFALSIVIALKSPRVAQLPWVAVAVVPPLAERWARRRRVLSSTQMCDATGLRSVDASCARPR